MDRQNNKLLIINYHNICDNNSTLPGIHYKTLDKQLKFLRQFMNPMPLTTALELSQQNKLPNRAVAITFDDGYKSHLTLAMPLLKKHGLNAAFFISSNHNGTKLMWNDRLYLAIMRCPLKQINVDEFELGDISIESAQDKQVAFNKLVQLFKYQTLRQRHQLLTQLCRKLSFEVESSSDNLMLSENEIKMLSDNGMLIGSHTLDHPILALEERQVALNQLSEDKARLEMLIDKPVSLFAFPNGKPGYDYNEETIELIKRSGYKYAFTTCNTPFEQHANSLYEIPRMSAPASAKMSFLRFIVSAQLHSNKQQKVLFVENGKGFGGASLALAEILENWPKSENYTPIVCVNSHDEKYQIYDKFGEKLVYPKLKIRSIQNKSKLASLFSFAWDSINKTILSIIILHKVKPEIVHLNNDPYNCYHVAIAAKLLGIPYIMHIRGNMTPSKLSRWVCDNATQNIAISSWIQSSIQQAVSKNKTNYQLICDGITLQTAPVIQTNAPKQIKMIMVGGFYGWKGQQVVVHAFAKIAKLYPNIYLDFVGSIEPANDEQLKVETLIKKYQLEDKIKLVPFANDISKVYQQAQILIHASTDPEPFGRVVAEAMSAGLVVVASNQGGPLDIISDKTDGFLVTPNDPAKLAEILTYILNNYSNLAGLRYAAITKAKQFSSERNAAQVYQTIIQNINAN
ncbi:glycosyltransferase [Catenovulum adriaticum]|uniref:Glycosyltransferase n=1 Tax=Catenovulum adriaticum TaxID=2984846 RepID=A0ABY7AN58_9ALTE|nr:glycosyltransferase [Catenovulum sp. TS8]WAJ70697.1 glycosyltransferase [Catenovulum sp. TS8]